MVKAWVRRGGAGLLMLGLLLLAALVVAAGVVLFVLNEPPMPSLPPPPLMPPPGARPLPPPGAHVAPALSNATFVGAPPASPPPRAADHRSMSMAEFLRRLSQIKSATGTGGGDEALAALGREIALEDFANALKLMAAISDTGMRLGICRGIFELGGATNPTEALRQARLLAPAASADPAAGRVETARAKQLYFEALRSTLRGWTGLDPAAAAAQISEMPLEYQAALAETVYGAWAKSNPETALRGVEALPAPMRSQALSQVCQSWAEQDAPAAWAYTANLPADSLPGRAQILANIATAWARQDVRSAVVAVGQSLPDQGLYAWTLDRMVKGLAAKTPDKAAEMFAVVPGLVQRQGDTLTAALGLWATKDAAAAAEWAVAVEEPEVQGLAVKAVASYWASRDPAAAMTWASTLTDPVQRAYALSNVAVQQGQKNPEASLDWIDRQPDPFVRGRCLAGYVMGRLRGSGDGQAAYALRDVIMSDQIDFNVVIETVQQAKISDAEKNALIALLQ
jgi:hypothetical protein